jgi:hypothetical protein
MTGVTSLVVALTSGDVTTRSLRRSPELDYPSGSPEVY